MTRRKIAFKSRLFAMLNVMFEIRFLGFFLPELRAAPVSWEEAECFVQDVPGASQPQPALGCCLPSAGAGTFVPGVWSQSCCVLGVTKLPNSEVQRTLSLEQLSGPRTCVLSAEQLTLGVTQVCNPLDRAGVSEHHQGSCCRPVLTMARKLYSCVPHLSCASTSLIVQGDVGAEILV